jgi:hypothetical protein
MPDNDLVGGGGPGVDKGRFVLPGGSSGWALEASLKAGFLGNESSLVGLAFLVSLNLRLIRKQAAALRVASDLA